MQNNDNWHRKEYEKALDSAGISGPEWNDLTNEQRENIRNANNQHENFINALVEAIQNGTDLPNVNDFYQ